MADIFSTENARKLFQDKFVFILGDSNMRATYKDLVRLMSRNALLDNTSLRKKGEPSFEGDNRIRWSGLIRGRAYQEGREYVKNGVHLEYHFLTRCYTSDLEFFLKKIKDKQMKIPDVIIMNSCLWDISRWGPDGVDTFKDNMKKLMLLLKECLPEQTRFIWTTTLPVSEVVCGQVLVKQLNFLQSVLRFEIMEANLFSRYLIVSHGYDVLDTHYHLRMQVHRRSKDGIHYGPLPVRFVTNLLLTHISLAWNVPLPGNTKGIALERVLRSCVLTISEKSEEKIELPKLPNCLDRISKNEPTRPKFQARRRGKSKFGPRENRNSWTNKRKDTQLSWTNNVQNSNTESAQSRTNNIQKSRPEPWSVPPPWLNKPRQELSKQSFWQDNIPSFRFGSPQWVLNCKETYQWNTYPDFDRAESVGPNQRNNNLTHSYRRNSEFSEYNKKDTRHNAINQAPWNKERVGGPMRQNKCQRTRPY